MTDDVRPLVIGCGALVAELRAVLATNSLTDSVDVVYLPANLHNTPDRIVDELDALYRSQRGDDRPVLVAYADCGTGGRLDIWLASHPNVTRLPGAHCYEVFAGADTFAALHDAEPGTFYLTDFLAKHFDALVWQGLGLDRHPSLRDMYFANYTRVVLLSQAADPAVVERAVGAAARLGLRFEHHHVGTGDLDAAVVTLGATRSHTTRSVA
jgi:hypothetical protein